MASIESSLKYIFDRFAVNNEVYLPTVTKFLADNKQMGDVARVFQLKASRAPESTMDRQEFMGYFMPQKPTREHFDAVFDSIDDDMSGLINQAQAKALFQKHGIEVNPDDIADMFEVVGQDGQVVSRDQLFDFLHPSK